MNYFKFVWRGLRRKKLRSWLTIIGILIGITAIVALVSLGKGLETAIASQFNFLSADLISVSSASKDPLTPVAKPLLKSYVTDIKRLKGVDNAAGRIARPAKVYFDKKIATTMIGSLPYDDERDMIYDVLSLKILKGHKLDEKKDNNVLVGYNLAKKVFNGKLKVGSKIKIKGETFIVEGILDKTGNFGLDLVVFMNENKVRSLFDLKQEYNYIGVKIKKDSNMKEVISEIERLLRKKRHVKEYNQDFEVTSSQAMMEQINGILGGVQIFVYIIAGISIIVSGIGITNTMFTSVLEKTKDIGIMKAIGATNKTIFILFLIESGSLGLIGGILGIIFGSSLATILATIGRKVFAKDIIQANISIFLILGALAFSFVVGTISGIIPAMKASKQNPIAALNYEK